MEQDCVGGFHIPSYKTSERYGTAPRLESKYGLSSFTPAGVTVETMYDGINPDEYDQEFNHRISTTEIAYWKIKTRKSGWKSDEILSKKQSDLLTWLLDSLAEVGPYYGKIEAVNRKLTMFRRKNEEVRRVSLMIIKKIPDLLSNYLELLQKKINSNNACIMCRDNKCGKPIVSNCCKLNFCHHCVESMGEVIVTRPKCPFCDTFIVLQSQCKFVKIITSKLRHKTNNQYICFIH